MHPIKFTLLYWCGFAFLFSVRYVVLLTRALGPWGQTLLDCWRLLSSTYSLSTFRPCRGYSPFRNLSTYHVVTNKCTSDVKKENKGDKQTKVINREEKTLAKILRFSEAWSGRSCWVVPDFVRLASKVKPRFFIGYSKLEDDDLSKLRTSHPITRTHNPEEWRLQIYSRQIWRTRKTSQSSLSVSVCKSGQILSAWYVRIISDSAVLLQMIH